MTLKYLFFKIKNKFVFMNYKFSLLYVKYTSLLNKKLSKLVKREI